MNIEINKDLKRIPLAYFNETVDRVFLEYIDLDRGYAELIARKQKAEMGDKESMIISKRMAFDSAIAKKEKASSDKLVILNGFIRVTSNMCESRIKEIRYLLKTHPEMILDEREEELLEEEQNGIFDYLAKVEQIKSSLPNNEKGKEDEGDSEPNA